MPVTSIHALADRLIDRSVRPVALSVRDPGYLSIRLSAAATFQREKGMNFIDRRRCFLNCTDHPEDNPIPVIGYSDRLSVQPGTTIRFMVSSDLPMSTRRYRAVDSCHRQPRGPGFKEQLVQTPVSREYR